MDTPASLNPWPTCFRATAVFAVILGVLVLAGCQTTEPRIVTKVVDRRIEIPASLLRCLPEPVAKEAWKLSSDAALFMNRLADAGQDCRSKLAAVKRLLDAQ